MKIIRNSTIKHLFLGKGKKTSEENMERMKINNLRNEKCGHN